MINIRQGEIESLCTYLSYFNMATLEVQQLDQSMAMIILNSGLQRNAFLFYLEKTYPQSFTKMFTWVKKYGNVEEAYNAYLVPTELKVVEKVESSRRVYEKDHQRSRRSYTMPCHRFRTLQRNQRNKFPPKGCINSPPRCFGNYIPLNISREQILMEVRAHLPSARKMHSRPECHNPNEYYLYHRYHERDTEDCLQLQDEVE